MSFDADWMRGQSVGIYPVHNSAPEPVISELEKIMDSGEGGLSQNLVKLQPIGRLNAILVVASKPNLLRTTATWISRLDKSDTTMTGVRVYRVRYGEARQLAGLLNDIFGGRGAGAVDSAANQIAPSSSAVVQSSVDRSVPDQPGLRIAGARTQPGGTDTTSRERSSACARCRRRQCLRPHAPAAPGPARRAAGSADHRRRRQQHAADLCQSGELPDHRAHAASARPAAAAGRDRSHHRGDQPQRKPCLRRPVLPQEQRHRPRARQGLRRLRPVEHAERPAP